MIQKQLQAKEIDRMPANREMDRLIAERLGWKWRVWNLDAYKKVAVEIPPTVEEEAQQGLRFLIPPPMKVNGPIYLRPERNPSLISITFGH